MLCMPLRRLRIQLERTAHLLHASTMSASYQSLKPETCNTLRNVVGLGKRNDGLECRLLSFRFNQVGHGNLPRSNALLTS